MVDTQHEELPGRNSEDQDAISQEIKRVSAPLARGSGWMRFIAVLLIISAVAMWVFGVIALWLSVGPSSWQWQGIFALALGWIPIWLGVILFRAASAASAAHSSGSPRRLFDALNGLRRLFTILGVAYAIGLVLLVVSMGFLVVR